jgi:hypothetical protein
MSYLTGVELSLGKHVEVIRSRASPGVREGFAGLLGTADHGGRGGASLNVRYGM